MQLHRHRSGLRSPRRRRPQPALAPACTAGLLCDLLWSDPELDVTGWAENDRGVSYTFGADVVGKFLSKHDFDLVVRAHQVVEDGYEFFADRQLVTIFSAPNYCGEFDNAGAVRCLLPPPPRRPPPRPRRSPARVERLLRGLAAACARPTHAQVMAVDESLMCSFRILKPAEKQKSFGFGSRPLTPPRKR